MAAASLRCHVVPATHLSPAAPLSHSRSPAAACPSPGPYPAPRASLARQSGGARVFRGPLGFGLRAVPCGVGRRRRATAAARADVEAPSAPAPKPRARPGEHKGFVEEMRITAMKLHTKDQSKEGQKEEEEEKKPLGVWAPTKGGYLQFLVDSKAVYETMEAIVAKAAHPIYAQFRDTGLERSAKLAEDIAWFESQGITIPHPGKDGTAYSTLLTELSETDPQAFICHFYNVYFAHSAGGRMIGRKVAEMILDSRELNFYKWDGDLQQLLSDVKEKLNLVAKDWTREEKDRCLRETEKSFKYSGNILRLIAS